MKEVLNCNEACQFLRLAKPTLYKYIRAGKIPAFKVGKVWRFHKEVLNDWVKNRVQEDTLAAQERVK